MATSRGLFKEVFAEPLKDRSVLARRTLAHTLLEDAAKPDRTPADRFALLGGAIQAAREGADLPLCFEAAETMARSFDIDDLSLKLDAANRISLRGDSQGAAVENVTAGLEFVNSLVAAEDFTDAIHLVTLLRSAAANDITLKLALQRQSQNLGQLEVARNRYQPFADKLKASPNDAVANFEVGAYYALKLGQWERGLPFLARGENAEVRTLAALELSKPEKTEDLLRLGNGWWNLANPSDVAHDPFARHAAKIYLPLLDATTGLQKEALEGRIAKASDAESSPAPVTIFNDIGKSRRVLFCISESGSMLDKMATVKDQLAIAVRGLSSQQAFGIIFYRGEGIDSLSSSLLPASAQNKQKAIDFLTKVIAGGTSNPLPALTAAFQENPDTIYFFISIFPDDNAALSRIRTLNHLKKVKIHTLVFDQNIPEAEKLNTERTLQTIASDNGGTYKMVDVNNINVGSTVRPSTNTPSIPNSKSGAGESWVQIFNGKDLTGWSVDGGDPATWIVRDGVIVALGQDYRTRNYLLSEREYSNYILRFDFMLDRGAGGGVAFRAVPGERMPYPNGPAGFDHPILKLLDIPGKEETGTTHWLNGNMYVKPKHTAQMLPAGSWNSMEINVKIHEVSVFVNGKLVTIDGVAPGVRFADGSLPGLNRVKGRIGFQKHHGTERFRNIEIREMP
ncbi:MAG TPA: family 16 glycoside hydrolase [Tepidisphaeraceae bacterium]|nr:family 16 glycoside hydrolase [Tepidisphaeraceae bacterium]